MTRILNYEQVYAFETAVSLFDVREHVTIKLVGPQNGANKAVILPRSHYEYKLRRMAKRGEILSDLPGYMVIDSDGKPAAICYFIPH